MPFVMSEIKVIYDILVTSNYYNKLKLLVLGSLMSYVNNQFQRARFDILFQR